MEHLIYGLLILLFGATSYYSGYVSSSDECKAKCPYKRKWRKETE